VTNDKLRVVKDEQPAESPKEQVANWRKWAGAAGVLVGGGLAVHAVLSWREKKYMRPPGRMVEIDGHAMHLLATGSGEPTVVLETGVAGYFGSWEWVQQEVEKHTRVVSYDRAGLGFSEKTYSKRDAASIARELNELLTRAGEKPPYILVGHAFGGLLVLEYAHLFPERTAAVVLVDPSHPEETDRNADLRKSMQTSRTFFRVASAASHFGVMRVTDMLSTMSEGLSNNERARGRLFYVSPRHLRSSARELDSWQETTQQVRSASLGDKPLLILSAGEPEAPWVKDLQTMHGEMRNLSTRSAHRILPGVEHENIVTRQENALQVSRAILELVQEFRHSL
jgi:pimeloyl-ACP methyl ester carboxylesterase